MERDLDHWLQIALFQLSEAGRRSLTELDDEYARQSWQELKAAIDMRKYLLWRLQMHSLYSDISRYMTQHRICWTPRRPSDYSVKSPTPFEHPSDYWIRRNDWPYGLTADTVHMVVWLKTPIEVDEIADPTLASRRLIEDFVTKVFRHQVEPDSAYSEQVMWFKNRARWPSVRVLGHIHVIVPGVDPALIEEWTE